MTFYFGYVFFYIKKIKDEQLFVLKLIIIYISFKDIEML